jgi:hypothetical protein
MAEGMGRCRAVTPLGRAIRGEALPSAGYLTVKGPKACRRDSPVDCTYSLLSTFILISMWFVQPGMAPPLNAGCSGEGARVAPSRNSVKLEGACSLGLSTDSSFGEVGMGMLSTIMSTFQDR